MTIETTPEQRERAIVALTPSLEAFAVELEVLADDRASEFGMPTPLLTLWFAELSREGVSAV